MNNKIIFGQYFESDSLLHRLDPRTKLISLLLLAISLFIIDNIYVLLGLSLFLVILIILTKVPINKFFKSIRMMSYIMIFTFIMQLLVNQTGNQIADLNFNLTILNLIIILLVLLMWLVFNKYIKAFKVTIFIALLISLFVLQYFVYITPSIVIYNIKITDAGLKEASLIVIRIIDFLFISSLLTLTTKPTQINTALEKLLRPLKKIGVNASSVAMIISITLRFIPTLIEEASKILKAQASRGADFKDEKLINKVFQMVSLIVPLFTITYKKASDLTYAMEARGYVEKKDRSSIYLLKYKTIDLISICLMCLIFAFSIISRFMFI